MWSFALSPSEEHPHDCCVARGNGEYTSFDQGPQLMNYPAAMTGISQAVGSSLSQPVALDEFSKQQPTRIRGDMAEMKIGPDLFARKTFKTELFMADCIHKSVVANVLFV
jgi:hypothetical protein